MQQTKEAARKALDNTNSKVLIYFSLLCQLALAGVVFERFALESPDFRKGLAIFVAAAALSWFLPRTWRLSILSVSAVIALFAVFDVDSVLIALAVFAPVVVLLSSSLSGVTRAIGLVLVSATVLAARRFNLSENMVLIIGATLAFRAFFYLRESRLRASWGEAVAYFFLFPAFVMPFFPAVAFRRFKRGLDSKADVGLYQRGICWIVTGTVQLLLYRLVIKDAMFFPFANVVDIGDALHFILLNGLRFLQVSGSFWVAIGALLLFGIDLPRPHNKYFFARSLGEYWWRVNFYWKDFMTRAVFLPVYVRLRRMGRPAAHFIALMIMCTLSWILHSYMVLWLRGEFPLELRDMVFWEGLGLGMFLDFQFARHAGSADHENSFFAMAHLAIRISRTFLIVVFLWAAWTIPDFRLFSYRMTHLRWSGMGDLAWVLPFAAVGGLGALARNYEPSAGPREFLNKLRRGPYFTIPTLVALAVISWPAVTSMLDERGSDALWLVDSLLNEEHPLFHRTDGFYEGRDQVLPTTWAAPIPVATNERDERIESRVPDYRIYEYRANASAIVAGKPFKTNRWGMQDRDRALVKAPESVRVALIGASFCMPWRIAPGEVWHVRAEGALNAAAEAGGDPRHVEILNFGAYGYSPLLYPYVYEKKASRFKPDILLLELESGAFERTGISIAGALHKHLDFPYPELFSLIGISSSESLFANFYPATTGLEREAAVVDWSLKKLAGQSANDGARRILVHLPLPIDTLWPLEPRARLNARLEEAAKRQGFDIIDLTDVLDRYSLGAVLLRAEGPRQVYDNHLNSFGHAIVAREFAKRFATYLGLSTAGL